MRRLKRSYLVLIITLIVGLAIGFVGRPVATKDLPEAVATNGASDSPEVAQATPAAQPTVPPTKVKKDSSQNDATPTIMDFVLSDARHFQGSANAPVTLVEFSDFN